MTAAKDIVGRFVAHKHPTSGGYYVCGVKELTLLVAAAQQDALAAAREDAREEQSKARVYRKPSLT